MADDLSFASVRELGRKLRAGDTSAVALAEHFLARLQKHGPQLNAVVTVTRELALKQAEEADRELRTDRDRGPLHGIPYGAKDLLAVPNHPTTWGAAPYRKQMLDGEATVVRKMREAGAVLVAKLAMVELAGGLGYNVADAAFTGPGLNPWERGSWAGGSSSGSGAAVAAGLVPLAIGTETCGSIVTPAAYCGVTGLRPTYGRVSRHGGMTLCWTMDKLGPMARTADDCSLALAAIAGPDPLDPTCESRPYADAGATTDQAARPFNLAVVRDAAANSQPAVRENYERSLALLREQAEITEIELPSLPYGAVVGTIVDCESAEAFEELVADGRIHELAAPRDRVGLQAELFIPARDYLRAQRVRRVIQRELTELMRPYDALVTPARPHVAPPIDRTFDEYGSAWHGPPVATAENCAGLPGLTLPNGFGERGLPTALHLVGRAWDEARLVAIGRYLQSRTDWHTQTPAV